MSSEDFDAKLEKLFAESAIFAWEHLQFDLERCGSPIEQLFLYALWSRGCWYDKLVLTKLPFDQMRKHRGIDRRSVCAPQVQIGKYRVDFLFAQGLDRGDPYLLAVECDGHDFHEKTKEQAARDKARDRDLMERGVQVMRFTGSEIWRDPGECAAQVLMHLESQWAESAYQEFRRAEEQASKAH